MEIGEFNDIVNIVIRAPTNSAEPRCAKFSNVTDVCLLQQYNYYLNESIINLITEEWFMLPIDHDGIALLLLPVDWSRKCFGCHRTLDLFGQIGFVGWWQSENRRESALAAHPFGLSFPFA
jgi:hypothetical protein